MEDTSVAVPKAESNENENHGGGVGGAAAGAGAVVAGAHLGMMGLAGAGIAKAMAAVIGVLSKVLSAVGSFFGAVGSAVTTVAIWIGTGIVTVCVTIATFGQMDATANVILNDVVYEDEDCRVVYPGTSVTDNPSTDLTSAEVSKNIYIIYNALTQWGMTHNQAIGVLVNMHHESGIIPYCVQGHYSDLAYGKTIVDVTQYKDHGGGVGLVQWSDANGKKALNDNRGSHNWWDLDYQVSFFLSDRDVLYPRTTKYLSKTANLDAVNCVRYFLRHWEICGGADKAKDYTEPGKAGTHYYERWNAAPTDVAQMEAALTQAQATYSSDSDADATVASILSQASTASVDGAAIAIASSACSYGYYDNSSIATAAVSFAWPTVDDAYNDGTGLYINVYNKIFEDRTYYKACDRCVICAVVWSGTDINFMHLSGVDGIYDYLESSEGRCKWTKVGIMGEGTDFASLQPGDILIITASVRCQEHGHTLIYTGNELIQQVHAGKANPEANVVSASYLDTSPHCGTAYDATYYGYSVYRCTNPDHATNFSDAGGYIDSE